MVTERSGSTSASRVDWPSVAVAAFVLLVGGFVFYNWVVRSLPMVDIAVYRSGGFKLVHGVPLYDGKVEDVWLPFTYPPFAAIVFVPFALIGAWGGGLVISVLSYVALARACWLLVGSRWPTLGQPQRWQATGFMWAAAALAEPVTATLGFGQINLIILWMVLEDLLGPTRRSRGILVGIATGLKLTPGIFILLFVVIGKRTSAVRAAGALAATILLGLIVQPQQAWLYWTKLAYDDKRVGGVAYVANQSLNGVIWRLAGPGGSRALWLLVVVAVAGVALWSARRLWLAGQPLEAVAVTALAMLLVSPISWSHHWVWVLPAAVALTGIVHRRVGWGLLAAGVIVFYSRGIFRVPNTHDLEYDHNLWQQIVGNSYALWALAALAALAVDAHARTPQPAPVEVVTQPVR